MFVNRHAHARRSSPIATLRRLGQPVRERCELCSAELAEEHEHLLDAAATRLICSCTPCAILFSHRTNAKYQRVPREVVDLGDFRLTDLQWESFGLPIGLAFFVNSATLGKVFAVYPSPAGPTESPIPADCWEDLLQENHLLGKLKPDVEALLVNRLAGQRDTFRVGIDRCYRLVGLIRTHWQGFSGGNDVWHELDCFFQDLRRRSGSPGAAANA